MTPIQGKNTLIEMFITDTWFPILCGTDLSLSYQPEFITKTGPNSTAREYAIRTYDVSMSVTGLTKIANDSVLSVFYMLQTSIRRVKHSFRARFTDDLGVEKQIIMDAFVGPTTISGPATDFCNCTLELKGTGGITISDTTPDPGVTAFNYFSDSWPVVNGQSYVAVGTIPSNVDGWVLLATDLPEVVARSGEVLDKVTGTPGNGQYRWNTTLKRIEVDPTNPFNTGETVFIFFKR